MRRCWSEGRSLKTKIIAHRGYAKVYPENTLPAFMSAAHAVKLLVHAADCDTTETLQAALDRGVDQLSTNELALALTLRDKS